MTGEDDPLAKLLAVDTTNLDGGLNYIEASIEFRRVFDEAHALGTGDLGVEICDELRVGGGSLLEYWAERYDASKIFDKLHVPFDRFYKNPSHIMESMCHSAERMLDKDIKALEEIKRRAENPGQQKKK